MLIHCDLPALRRWAQRQSVRHRAGAVCGAQDGQDDQGRRPVPVAARISAGLRRCPAAASTVPADLPLTASIWRRGCRRSLRGAWPSPCHSRCRVHNPAPRLPFCIVHLYYSLHHLPGRHLIRARRPHVYLCFAPHPVALLYFFDCFCLALGLFCRAVPVARLPMPARNTLCCVRALRCKKLQETGDLMAS